MSAKPRGRNTTLIRTLAIWQAIAGRRTLPSLDSLADEHGVSTRTIRRDLQALAAARLPVPPTLRQRNEGAEC